jgi:hypothetical protein
MVMQPRQAHLRWAIFRVAVTTFLATAVSFAIALFFGIVTILVANLFHGGVANMTNAYRRVAFPIAMAVLGASFIFSVFVEIRDYWRSRHPGRMNIRQSA